MTYCLSKGEDFLFATREAARLLHEKDQLPQVRVLNCHLCVIFKYFHHL